MFLALLISVFSQKTNEIPMQFLKVESVGINPVNPLIIDDKVIYTRSCTDKMIKDFNKAEIYLIQYTGLRNESKAILVGNISCIFYSADNKWLIASTQLKKDVPENHVLRAKVRAKKSKDLPNGVTEIQEAEIVEFYLKPVDKATSFR